MNLLTCSSTSTILPSRRPRLSKPATRTSTLVAVQHAMHFLGRQKQVAAAFVRRDKAKAVRMTFDPALDQIEFVRQAQLALAVEHELAVALHRAEAALEQFELVFGDLQLLGKVRPHRPDNPHR